MPKLVLLLAIFSLAFQGRAAVAPYFKVGVGDQVKVNFAPFNTLASYMAADTVRNHFQTHWFHAGWKTHFPMAIAGGSCAGGGEWSSLADYQGVLNSGRILVIIWWWHNDMPCDSSIRADAQATATNCLVPLLQSLNNGEVWVIFEPEYNLSVGAAAGTGGACGANRIHRDPSWGTHLNTMITAAKGAAHAGLTVKAGPAVGGFGPDENVYNVELSLQNCYASSDFIAYHHITRTDIYLDDAWACPSPEAAKFSMSLSRYLRKRFNKPLIYAYWTSRNGLAGQAAQNADLLDHFANRATFEAEGVEAFGPYWYHDNGYPGEGIRQTASTAYTAFNTWRTEGNAVFDGVNGIHSLGFVSPDLADIVDAPGTLNMQWISRGRPATGYTYNTYYRVNGGADQAFANPYSTGGPYGDSTSFSAPLSLCSIAPSANVQVKAVASDTTFAYSRRFTVRNPNYSSNAQHIFDAAGQAHGWSAASAWFSGQKFSTVAQSTLNYFHGGGALELGGTFGNTGPTQKNAVGNNNSVVLGAGDPRTINLKAYISFDLNPSAEMGPAVSFLNYQVRLNSVIYDNYASATGIPLESGWNDVTITITAGTGGTIDHVDLVFYNEWGQAGNAFFSVGANPKIYIDEIHYGGPAVFTLSGSCASPTPTPVVTATSTFTPPAAGTSTFSPTRTPSYTPAAFSATPSPSASPAPSCAADWNWDDATLQNWVVDSGPATGLAALTTLPHDGSHSLRVNLALQQSAGNTQVLLRNSTGFPRDYSGQTLHYWLYIPAGMSDVANPSGATLYVKTGAGFAWNESTWVNLPSTAGWVEISFNVAAVPNINDVREVGLKIALGGTSPNPPASTVYIDSYGRIAGACASATPTATFTPTATRTATSAAASPTQTPSRTSSPSASPTLTRSPTPTASATRTQTVSATPSNSASPTRSVTPSNSPSPLAFSPTSTSTVTPTGTATPSQSPTPLISPSNTRSPTPTATSSISASPTRSITATATGSPSNSPSPSATRSVTPSFTPSMSPTPTATPSMTASFTAVPVGSSPTSTPTISATLTRSPTPSATPSATPTTTQTPVQSLTFTASRTSSLTPLSSATQSVTPSLTPSITPSMTVSPVLPSATPSESRTVSPTFSPSSVVSLNASTEYGQVLETSPSLNPQPGGILAVSVRINGRTDGFELRVVSKAMAVVARTELTGSYANGWHRLAFAVPELANGIWYYEIRAVNAGSKSGLPRVAKVMILK